MESLQSPGVVLYIQIAYNTANVVKTDEFVLQKWSKKVLYVNVIILCCHIMIILINANVFIIVLP